MYSALTVPSVFRDDLEGHDPKRLLGWTSLDLYLNNVAASSEFVLWTIIDFDR